MPAERGGGKTGIILQRRPHIGAVAGADDVETAKRIAHRKGLSCQTYIKMLLHDALRREAKAS